MLRYAALATLAFLSRAWGEALPDTMLGPWDVSSDACAEGFAYSTTRVEIEPDRMLFHYGHAGIEEIAVSRAEGRPPVAFLRASLWQEGMAEPGPQDVFYRLEHPAGADSLGFTWKDAVRQELVRCAPDAGIDGTSRYAPLDLATCDVLSVDAEGGGASLLCPGQDGVDLYVTEGDLRFDVDVGQPDGAFIATGPFNTLGDTVEWRYGPEGGLRAVILRYHFDVDGTGATRSELAVIRPGFPGQPSCYVAFVAADATGGQNIEARRIADTAGRRPCISGR